MDSSPLAHYVIAGGAEGRARLRILAEATRDGTSSMLRRLGIRRNWRIIDVGCGGGDVVRQLVEFVDAVVVGIDADESVIATATEEARLGGFGPVDYRVGDVMRPDPDDVEQFDLVYSRFLLTHLPDPAPALDGMLRHVRPGGTLAIEDIDLDGSFCWPPSAAYDAFVRWYGAAHRAKGGDPTIGRRLPSLLRQRGLAGHRRPRQPPGRLRRCSWRGGQDDARRDGAGHRCLRRRDERRDRRSPDRSWPPTSPSPDRIVSMPRVVQVFGTVEPGGGRSDNNGGERR